MPAAYAHYCFGKKVYRALPKKEQEIIKEGKYAFLLGLHGPDLLFYYFPICKNRINQQGVRLHKHMAADFFEYGVEQYQKEQYQKEPDPALRAYLYGYLCHFMLDSECHPYINLYMEEKDLGHLEIETEFDRWLMERDGKLFPIEIKKMAAPPKKLTKVFELIEKSPLQRGTGAVLCMADCLSAFDQENWIVPISLI